MELKSVRFFVDFPVESRLGFIILSNHIKIVEIRSCMFVDCCYCDYSIFLSLMPSSSSSWRMTKYMSAQPTMKPSTMPISSLEWIAFKINLRLE